MSISSFFSPSCETRELHIDPQLRTRYYRNNFKDVLEALHTLAEKYHMNIQNVNEVHKEVYIIGHGHDCIVTIAQLSPIEAGIDFKVNMFSAVGLNRPKKKALQYYATLKELLKFKGVSLHP
ncbi:MAG: hypothetical protein KAH13_05615 [Tenericutes bacterium]|nr:hypothetical protein [Mycoplasmatota bacterium]